jgi:hypothetical protein
MRKNRCIFITYIHIRTYVRMYVGTCIVFHLEKSLNLVTLQVSYVATMYVHVQNATPSIATHLSFVINRVT